MYDDHDYLYVARCSESEIDKRTKKTLKERVGGRRKWKAGAGNVEAGFRGLRPGIYYVTGFNVHVSDTS